MTSPQIVKGDHSDLVVPCVDDETQAHIDLTSKTVTLRWINPAGAMVTRSMAIIAAGAGEAFPWKAHYQFIASDAPELIDPFTDFEARIADLSGNVITSLQLLHVAVRTPLA